MFREYIVDGSGQYPPKKLDMGWLVKFRLDMACESSGLRGKSRLWVVSFFQNNINKRTESSFLIRLISYPAHFLFGSKTFDFYAVGS